MSAGVGVEFLNLSLNKIKLQEIYRVRIPREFVHIPRRNLRIYWKGNSAHHGRRFVVAQMPIIVNLTSGEKSKEALLLLRALWRAIRVDQLNT